MQKYRKQERINKQQQTAPKPTQDTPSVNVIQKASIDQSSMNYQDVMQLQNTVGNRAVVQLFNDGSSSQAPVDNVIQRLVQTTTSNLNRNTPIQKKDGLPGELQNGLEQLSGMNLSDVKVHYNSPKPKSVGALAYAQGTDIFVGRGQEKHLPHEGWHTVQQKQGRVKPTMQLKNGVAVNDNAGLEREADVMGQKAVNLGQKMASSSDNAVQRVAQSNVIQRVDEVTTNSQASESVGPTKDEKEKQIEEYATLYQKIADQLHSRFKKAVTVLADKTFGFANVPPVKGLEKIKTKTLLKLGELEAKNKAYVFDANKLIDKVKDILRGRIIYEDFNDLTQGFKEALKYFKKHDIPMIKIETNFGNVKRGYKDAKIVADLIIPEQIVKPLQEEASKNDSTISIPSVIHAEIQFDLKMAIVTKEGELPKAPTGDDDELPGSIYIEEFNAKDLTDKVSSSTFGIEDGRTVPIFKTKLFIDRFKEYLLKQNKSIDEIRKKNKKLTNDQKRRENLNFLALKNISEIKLINNVHILSHELFDLSKGDKKVKNPYRDLLDKVRKDYRAFYELVQRSHGWTKKKGEYFGHFVEIQSKINDEQLKKVKTQSQGSSDDNPNELPKGLDVSFENRNVMGNKDEITK
ncbi:eCIS core domain-containing protein [Candidatus Uabimicrobium amorphum]|uniref:eCIS core domain-containing protein n=1 Tax=Uabimicrobium amorphum TaxID=2596890 RepID=A0A5S9IQS2_UABAM|nr:DUF4157 domain-containing protein [Candidatus Uabimicrobium amorphum]BBM86359.1 hypothetical protein UABAM_04745 [Candidatus Uabimicrobium amorphum]